MYALFGGSGGYYGWVADVSGRARGFGREIENKKSAREERVREEKDEKEG